MTEGPILHLGVNDVPYVERPTAPKRVAKARRKARPRTGSARASQTTTGAVAEMLEAKYHIYEVFYETHEEQIGQMILEGLANTYEALMSGAPIGLDPWATAMSKLEDLFKQWLSSGEAERSGIPGTPTMAARKRRSSRFKGKVASGPRPSFIDTGLYEGNFRSWMEERYMPRSA